MGVCARMNGRAVYIAYSSKEGGSSSGRFIAVYSDLRH